MNEEIMTPYELGERDEEFVSVIKARNAKQSDFIHELDMTDEEWEEAYDKAFEEGE